MAMLIAIVMRLNEDLCARARTQTARDLVQESGLYHHVIIFFL